MWKSVKTKSQKVLGANSYVSRSYRAKTGRVNHFLFPLKFIEKIHNYEITLDEVKNNQTELGILINKLNNDYNPKIPKKVNEKNDVLKPARKLLDVRKDIINFFKKEFFHIKVMYLKQKTKNQKKNQKKKKSKNLSNILRMNQRV